MRLKEFVFSFLIVALLVQCEGRASDNNVVDNQPLNIDTSADNQTIAEVEYIDTFFDRSVIRANLAQKIQGERALVVHAYIPLCDNEHQGIVPTSASLGDGMNLKSNLYWATSGGTKAYFKKKSDWKLIYDEYDIDTNVLERVVFERNYPNTTVYLVADAYRGDRMEETVNDFLAAISGNRPQNILFEGGSVLHVSDAADLFIFNGHNGLMDNITVKRWINETDKRSDVVMNSCLSYGYLQYELMYAGGYPLIRSKSLLYPGAYVLEQIIDDWVAQTDEKQMALNAGAAYCKKHDCGRGTKVYQSGW